MSYYIDIIDTASPLVQIVIEQASGGGLQLKWNGGDKKEDLAIVTSEFSFDMLDKTARDAAFKAYYTGNETRFKVQVINDADDSIVWQGFILPDLYSEPYKNGNLFVNFVATDGLGRLKGKYLSPEFYAVEKSVIAIYCEILRLTGLELDLYFAPAIENYLVKSWNSIYIDGELFLDKAKKKDAYKILEMLLKDSLCVCYQADNHWYIEGINRRHERQLSYKKYDPAGNLTATTVYERLLKRITPLVTPTVSIIPPYNEITVSHKKTASSLPKTASVETNDGWAVVTGVLGEIYPSAWMGNNGYYARCVAPSYNVILFNEFRFYGDPSITWSQDNTKFISLHKKLYFAKNDKVKMAFTFEIVHPATGEQGSVSTWNNVMKYEIIYNGSVLFSNFGGLVEDRENLIFDANGSCKIEIDHVFDAEGLLDVKIYRPTGRVAVNGVLGVKLSAAAIEVIGFKDTVEEVDLINDDFTVDAEVELTFAEDKTGFSDGFRLAKLKEDTASFNEVEVLILYGFTLNGKYYSVVQLDGANLIKEHPYQVFYGGNKIAVVDVIYNFSGGEQMVVETVLPYTSGSFFVKRYAVADMIESRNHWTQWTDAFYKIENVSYLKAVANIYRRMFNVAHEKLDVTALNAVKFNDIVLFNYEYLKDFVVLNCAWNLDTNKTTLTLGRSNYRDSLGENPSGENIPPIVVAGDDIYIDQENTSVHLLATAYDPDGEVVSQVWTQTAGDPGVIMFSPNALANTLIDLTGDFYTFQITVTDNAGATATDTINIIRTRNYNVTLDLIETVSKANNPKMLKQTFKLNISPPLVAGYVLTFNGEFYLNAYGDINKYLDVVQVTVWFNLNKNGVLLEGKQFKSATHASAPEVKETTAVIFNYVTGDNITAVLYAARDGIGSGVLKRMKALSQFKLQTVAIASGVGNITGLPILKETKIT